MSRETGPGPEQEKAFEPMNHDVMNQFNGPRLLADEILEELPSGGMTEDEARDLLQKTEKQLSYHGYATREHASGNPGFVDLDAALNKVDPEQARAYDALIEQLNAALDGIGDPKECAETIRRLADAASELVGQKKV